MNFSDYFHVKPIELESYGTINISLIADLPLFIDPFLLFNSKNSEYRQLHDDIIKYLIFLRKKSLEGTLDPGLIKAWFKFKEVKQNWFGYSVLGNGGNGLGNKFANALNKNLHRLFKDFGKEKITDSSHLEKLCLIDDGVGKDHISDFTTNLIKEFLCNYTQTFAKRYINEKYRKDRPIEKIKFNYNTETWESRVYNLPIFNKDFVLLTPKNILSKDEQWINKNDIVSELNDIIQSIPDDVQRAQLNNYLIKLMEEHIKESKEDKNKAKRRFIFRNPQLIDYYIKYKELNGYKATNLSKQKILYTEDVLIQNVNDFCNLLYKYTDFYKIQDIDRLEKADSYRETKNRIEYFKHIIEDKDGYKVFYYKGSPIKNEKDAQVMFKLVWYNTLFDVNSEVNNGRGAVDFSVSKGKKNKTLVEFKLASNTHLKNNLAKQVKIYEKAHDTNKSYKVIIFFDDGELDSVMGILEDLKMDKYIDKNIYLIDARKKISASKVK